jgi:hypothetical protein
MYMDTLCKDQDIHGYPVQGPRYTCIPHCISYSQYTNNWGSACWCVCGGVILSFNSESEINAIT